MPDAFRLVKHENRDLSLTCSLPFIIKLKQMVCSSLEENSKKYLGAEDLNLRANLVNGFS